VDSIEIEETVDYKDLQNEIDDLETEIFDKKEEIEEMEDTL